MADDTDDKADLARLNKREDFPGWRESMKLYALEKAVDQCRKQNKKIN